MLKTALAMNCASTHTLLSFRCVLQYLTRDDCVLGLTLEFLVCAQSIEVLQLARRRRAKLYYLRDRPVKESYISPRFEGTRSVPGEPIPVIKANPNRTKVVKREPHRRLVTKRYIKAKLKKELKQERRPERIKLSKRHERRFKAGRINLPPKEERPTTLLSNPEIRHELKRRVRRIYRQDKARAKLSQAAALEAKHRS
eukprot:m.145056 g.145056  ORF g.145056 m.145056 type:complete len:198 (+) comp16212_c0_seq2:480-1073(+)